MIPYDGYQSGRESDEPPLLEAASKQHCRPASHAARSEGVRDSEAGEMAAAASALGSCQRSQGCASLPTCRRALSVASLW